MKCFFCEPEDKTIIAENGSSYLIYDEYPVTKGHLLIVSKEHLNSIDHLNDKIIGDIISLCKTAIKYLRKNYQPDGFNIGLNDQKVAGQTVNHLHIHIIPRYEYDTLDPVGGIRSVIPTKRKYGHLLKSGKLIRDNIPSILKEKGLNANYILLDNEEYEKQLKIKLMEEINEFIDTDDIHELCDLLEIIICILKFKDTKWSDFETMLNEKRNSNGSFIEKLFLLEDNSNNKIYYSSISN